MNIMFRLSLLITFGIRNEKKKKDLIYSNGEKYVWLERMGKKGGEWTQIPLFS